MARAQPIQLLGLITRDGSNQHAQAYQGSKIYAYTYSAKYVELFWAYITFSPGLLNYWTINNPSTANPQALKFSSNPTNVWLFGDRYQWIGEGFNGRGPTLGHANHGGRGGKISRRCKDLQNSNPIGFP